MEVAGWFHLLRHKNRRLPPPVAAVGEATGRVLGNPSPACTVTQIIEQPSPLVTRVLNGMKTEATTGVPKTFAFPDQRGLLPCLADLVEGLLAWVRDIPGFVTNSVRDLVPVSLQGTSRAVSGVWQHPTPPAAVKADWRLRQRRSDKASRCAPRDGNMEGQSPTDSWRQPSCD